MTRLDLLRYNFRVLMFHNWWLLVIPLAASQLTVFWNIVTQRFSPDLPAQTVEMVSPLLAAFLSAHLLSAEYRSGIGAVLASKPVDIGKVVLMRLLVVLALVWTLGLLSLLAFRFGMEKYPAAVPAFAGMVSSLFLALFALTFATLFRNPLAGFGVAGLYWALDLPPGTPLNPSLSLRSLTSSFPPPGTPADQPLTTQWWIAKILLVIAAAALYALHGRLLFTLGSPLTLRRRRRALAWAGGILAFYLFSGAAHKVAYGYANRGHLPPDDATWFRRQFAPYSPLPVAAVFGPNFRRYVGEIPNIWRIQQEGEPDLLGDSIQHRRDLRRILDTAPYSLWAPSAAELLARLEAKGHKSAEEKAAYYRVILDRYPNSPYLPFALRQTARAYADEAQETDYLRPDLAAKAQAAYETLVEKHPGSAYESEAFRFLAESDRRRGNLPAAARRAQQWIDAAPVQEKFSAYLTLAEILRDQGKTEEAKQAAARSLDAVRAFRRAVQSGVLIADGGRKTRWEHEAAAVEARARVMRE